MPDQGKQPAFGILHCKLLEERRLEAKKRLPVFIYLRDLREGDTIIGAIVQQFELFDIKHPQEVIESLLKGGECILLLDGYDEITKDMQGKLLLEIKRIKAKYSDTIICLSSRPYSLNVSLPSFGKWETLPLNKEDRIQFVKKWFHSVDIGKGERLLEKCKNKPELLDLGSSPLLLSIVCALYYNDLNIPKNRDELYARAVEGLLGAWDSFRNIARGSFLSELSVRRRVIFVSSLATHLFEQGKIVFGEDDIQDQYVRDLEHLFRMEAIDKHQILTTLYNDFGLLIERAPDLYSFSHLSLQEYLVANYIVDNRREMNLISEYLSDEDWYEIIILVTRMLPKADEFIKSLHLKLDIFDRYEGGILRDLWSTNPLCTENTKRDTLTGLVKRINPVTTKYTHEIRLYRKTLTINLKAKKRNKEFKKTGKTLRRNRINNEKTIFDKDVNSAHNAKNYNLQKDMDSILTIHKILQYSGYNYGLAGSSISPFLRVLNKYLDTDVERITINEKKAADN